VVKLFHPAALAGAGLSAVSFPGGAIPVRAARTRDHAALAALAAASFAQGAAALLPAGLRPQAHAERFAELFAAGGPLLVAGPKSQPLGCILAEPLQPGATTARLTGLWVAPAAMGQGAGSALLAAMEATLAASCVATLRVLVPSGHLRALGLFRRRGYGLQAAGHRAEPVLGVTLPHSVLAKVLPSLAHCALDHDAA
jgi:ribosomal protein S18 acetylase RimI-like enzyme